MPIGRVDGQFHDEGVFRGVASVEVEEERVLSSQSFALGPNLLVQQFQVFDFAWCGFGGFGGLRYGVGFHLWRGNQNLGVGGFQR